MPSSPSALPSLAGPGVRILGDPAAPQAADPPAGACDAILLVGAVSEQALARALAEAGEPALPVADFAANHGLRHDFAAEQPSAEAIERFRGLAAELRARLAQLPPAADQPAQSPLDLLRIAYAHGGTLPARLAPDWRLLVDYPSLGRPPSLRRTLEHLAGLGLLSRRHFTRTHACAACASSRLHAFEACPNCGGADLADEPLIHHYRCGCQEPESRFVQDRDLVCPKCRRTLRHFGMDYDKPGSVVMCRGCGTACAEPVASFVCLDCAACTPADTAAATDWYQYDLTEDGVQALHAGRLPQLDLASLLDTSGRTFSFPEFRQLATETLRIGRRYRRPFVLARIDFGDAEALTRELGPVRLDAAFRLATRLVLEAVRECDFVTAAGATVLLLGLPETPPETAETIIGRIRDTVAARIAAPFALKTTLLDEDAALDLLDGAAP